jgi:NADH-quinone oxidoreductase subunit H
MATHTTFEGEVEVAFAAAAHGAPPVGGSLARVVFDVRPTLRASDAARDAEGARLIEWLGAHAAPAPDTRVAAGVTLDAVTPGSRAEAAGLAAGDVVTRFDGVRVASVGDVLPAPGEREATAGVRRRGSTDETTVAVGVSGFRRAPLDQLALPLLLVLAALALVFLFAAPTPWLLRDLLDGTVVRIRSRALAAYGAPSAHRAPAPGLLASAVAQVVPPAGSSAVADAAACALLSLMPFGQYLVASQLDVGVLFLGAATAVATAALLGGGAASRGVKSALHVLWQHVPGAVAVLCVVVSTGSVRIQEIARAQGGAPWQWMALRSPPLLAALGLLLASALVEPEEQAPRQGLAALVEDTGDGDAGDPGARSSGTGSGRGRRVRHPWLDAAARTHRLVLAGLAVALLLGGWRVPGVVPAVQDARPALELAGAALYLGKTWAVVVGLALVRSLGSRPSLGERSRAVALRLLPLSFATLGATALWAWWRPAPAVEVLAGGVLAVLVVAVLAALVARVRHALAAAGRNAAADGSRVSVFL